MAVGSSPNGALETVFLCSFCWVLSASCHYACVLGASLVDTSNGSLHVFNWFWDVALNPAATWVALAVAIASLLVFVPACKINEAQQVITINYAKRVRGSQQLRRSQSILPIKLIAAGVIPVIFAVAFWPPCIRGAGTQGWRQPAVPDRDNKPHHMVPGATARPHFTGDMGYHRCIAKLLCIK